MSDCRRFIYFNGFPFRLNINRKVSKLSLKSKPEFWLSLLSLKHLDLKQTNKQKISLSAHEIHLKYFLQLFNFHFKGFFVHYKVQSKKQPGQISTKLLPSLYICKSESLCDMSKVKKQNTTEQDLELRGL